ncbi:MAG: sugar phosphate isomerase/epimerase family protein [Anaerolineae bacterium]
MRLGISSYAYPWSVGVAGAAPAHRMTAPDLVREAARLGVHVLQFADNLPLDGLTDAELMQFTALAHGSGVDLEVGTRGIARDLLQSYLRIALTVGSPIVRVVIDTASHRPNTDEIVVTLKPLLQAYEAEGVTLAIENHDRFKARDLVRILQRLDSPAVGVCLDTANSLGALEGTEAVLAALVPWTVNLHVKDISILRSNRGLGFVVEGRPAGQGMLDIPALLALLAAHGRDPNAIIELWPPAEATLEQTAAKERRWVEESVAYMRGLIPD